MAGRVISNFGRQRQLDFGTAAKLTPDFQPSPNHFGALTDARQTPVSFATALPEETGIHTDSVVANAQSKDSMVITDVQFYMAGTGVAESICQGFFPYTVQVGSQGHL